MRMMIVPIHSIVVRVKWITASKVPTQHLACRKCHVSAGHGLLRDVHDTGLAAVGAMEMFQACFYHTGILTYEMWYSLNNTGFQIEFLIQSLSIFLIYFQNKLWAYAKEIARGLFWKSWMLELLFISKLLWCCRKSFLLETPSTTPIFSAIKNMLLKKCVSTCFMCDYWSCCFLML